MKGLGHPVCGKPFLLYDAHRGFDAASPISAGGNALPNPRSFRVSDVLALSFADDTLAPAEAVSDLASYYSRAKVCREHIDPAAIETIRTGGTPTLTIADE